MGESRIQAIDHIHLEAVRGIEERMRWFYRDVVGLSEVACDADDEFALRFKSERIEIRVRVAASPQIGSTAVRLAVGASSLEGIAERLDERKWGYVVLRGLMWTDRRIETLDPAGHRVALKRHWPTGPI
jgi:hypothetical protein